jgi:hypothetical protein
MHIFSVLRKVLAVSLLVLSQSVYAQTPYPDDQAGILKQLETVLTSTGRKDMKDAFELFEGRCKAGAFTADQLKIVASTLNRMQKERLSVNPYTGQYIEAASYSLRLAGSGFDRFSSWHLMLDEMFKIKEEMRSSEQFKNFMLFSVSFLQNQTIRESEGGQNWIATSDRYQFILNDKRPSVQWDITDIKLKRGTDSIIIYQTKGSYFPLDFKWVADGGKVRWGDRIDEMKEVEATLSHYEIDTRRGLFEADSVMLKYPLLLGSEQFMGKIEDKMTVGNERAEGSYPRFSSYSQRLEFQNLGAGVVCIGGLKLNGSSIYAIGTQNSRAFILIKDDQGKRFQAFSTSFSIKREELITSQQVETSLYFGKDSIWHPSVGLRYSIKKKELDLKRGDKGSDRNPFFDSYHQFTISADRINWPIQQDSIFIGKRLAGAGDFDKTMVLESTLFFREGDYIRVQNVGDYNPIARLKVASEQRNTRFISAEEAAKLFDAKLNAGMVEPLLFNLSAQGFIKYDPESQQIELLDKLFHYANASAKRVDFDVIRITSESDKFDNAVISLRDTGMVVNAVNSFELSAKQQVALKPDAQFITVRDDRDIDFDGRLFAGFTTYMGKDFHFDYDKFIVELDSARFMDIYIPNGGKDEKNKPTYTSLKSRIEHLTAVLQVDAPNNKSGREELPFFPSIQSRSFSYVFYDYPETRGKIYKRDSFYFKLDKFFLNSLDSLSPVDIKFKGNMYTSEIFPVFKEELEVMPDTSLGFFYKTPAAGLANYRNRGNHLGDLVLSNVGFLATGTMTYIGSTCLSDSFVYMPHQMLALAKRWDNKENRSGAVPFPQAVGINASVDWHPYTDSMYVHSGKSPFDMYRTNDHKLTGTLIMTPKGLNGLGTLDWTKAVMRSGQFAFGPFQASADTTYLGIKTKDSQIAVEMDNIDGKADFDNNIGQFKTNNQFGTARMPSISYVTNMNSFDWNMKDDKVNFLSDPNRMAGFTSVHPDQDSLYFQGKTALYDINANQLNVGGVPYIQTCDAYIYPSDGKVVISQGAVMGTLNDARIVCDTIIKHHVINRVTANIKGKKLYTATGYYEYNVGKYTQEILFSDIAGQRIGKGDRSEKATETRATGIIGDSTQFFMDFKTEFRGKIGLFGSNKNLEFDGFARFDAPSLPGRQWFSIKSSGDKQNLMIAFNQPKNYEGHPLKTGFFVSAESSVLYPRVMQATYFTKDRAVMPVTGVFKYNQANDEFIFGDSSKLILNGNRGTKVTYSIKNSQLIGEGPMQIGSGLKNCKLTSAGRISSEFLSEEAYLIARDTVTGDLTLPPHKNNIMCMAGVNFDLLPETLLRIMSSRLMAESMGAPEMTYTADKAFYENALAELFTDPKKYLAITNEMNIRTLNITPKDNPYQFLFSNLKLKWDQDNQSFVSAGERVGINYIMGNNFNKQIKAYIEVRMPKNGDDRLYIHLESEAGTFYFFGYNQGVLSITSNDDKFNQSLLSLKGKDLIKKLDDGSQYEMTYVEPSTAKAFISRALAAQSRQ